MIDQDSDSLLSFVNDGSQDAFAELVDRYAPLVYHTAFRRTGDAELAKETSQTVFAVLARRASSLDGKGGLAGWLHRTALLQATQAMRREKRHRSRVKTYAARHQDSSMETATDTCPDTLVYLDEALARLRDGDRRAILLRFYDGLSLAEVGAAMGKSEEAARKQLSRALDKLAAAMRHRGATVSAVTLSSTLISQITAAVPIETAKALSSSALSSASPVSHTTLWSNIILTMKSSHLIAIVALLAILPLSWQQWTLAQERNELAFLKREQIRLLSSASLAQDQASILANANRGAPPRSIDLAALDLLQFAKDLEEANDGDLQVMAANAEIFNALENEGGARLASLIEETLTLKSLRHGDRHSLLDEFFQRLSPLDAEATAKLSLRAARVVNRSTHIQTHLATALRAWASEDPAEALSWYESEKQKGFETRSLTNADGVEDAALTGLIAGLFGPAPSQAAQRYSALTTELKLATLIHLSENAATIEPLREPLIRMTAKLSDADAKKSVLEPLLRLIEDPNEADPSD